MSKRNRTHKGRGVRARMSHVGVSNQLDEDYARRLEAHERRLADARHQRLTVTLPKINFGRRPEQ